eukprot:CAMPEP_0185287116 /NCGR_PEP_ID=MMETSP1363-20130426/2641_1 /TAXON_ID=38817 /ORGANISM="Gephyrocapsa oceanica, Strain RCC1303" /LENGTH=93 /DNA_ID=CAMNT_0027882947 /DNA_START=34 /DNA_END=315 /DNA_ORIENTATION=+
MVPTVRRVREVQHMSAQHPRSCLFTSPAQVVLAKGIVEYQAPGSREAVHHEMPAAGSGLIAERIHVVARKAVAAEDAGRGCAVGQAGAARRGG